MAKVFFIIIILFLSFNLLNAYTYLVSGTISENTTWSTYNNYQIQGTVYVANGVTLTVDWGVQVIFLEGSSLIVEGSLNATGNSEYPVTFKPTNYSAHPEYGYTNISFNNAENCSFVYCDFAGSNYSQGLITINGGSSTYSFTNCTVSANSNGCGIYVNNSSGNLNLSSSSVTNTSIDAIRLVNSSAVCNLNNVTLSNCQTGFKSTTGSTAGFTADNLTIANTSSYPISTSGYNYGLISNLTLTSPGINRLHINETTIDRNCTLTNLGVPYFMDASQNISAGKTFTIDPGVEILFAPYGFLNVYGSLQANGTSSQPVSLNTADPGTKWCSIVFSSSSASNMSYCNLSNGGSSNQYNYSQPNINVISIPTLTMSNCQIEGSQNQAVYLTGSSGNNILLNNLTINNCANTGVLVNRNDLNLNITGLTVTNSASTVKIPAELLNTLTQPIFSNNTNNKIILHYSGNISNKTFYNYGYTYQIEINLYSNSGSTTLIEPGVNFQFKEYLFMQLYGQLNATGTATQPIVFGVYPGSDHDWQGFIFESSAGNSKLNYCIFNDAGCTDQYNNRKDVILINRSDSLYIANTTINGSDGRGIYVDSADNTDKLTLLNVTISNCYLEGLNLRNFVQTDISGLNISYCNTYPLKIPPRCLPGINSLSLTNNGFNHIYLYNISSCGSMTFRNFGYPYQIAIGITTDVGSTVIAEAGVHFLMQNEISIYFNGSFYANGTSTDHVVFELAPNQSNHWTGLFFNSSASNAYFYYTDFIDGGRVNSSNGTLTNLLHFYYTNQTVLSNCTITNSLGKGIYAERADTGDALSIVNLMINNCTSDAVYVRDINYNLSISNLTVNYCSGYPLTLTPSQAGNISNLTFTNNTYNYIRLATFPNLGTLTLANHNYPYLVTVDLSINNGSTLTISPGCVIYIDNGFSINAYGSLMAVGTSEAPIIFDKSPLSASNWQQIYLTNTTSKAVFNYCTFSNAAKTSQYGHHTTVIQNDGADSVNVSNCLISTSQGSGISVSNYASTTDKLIIQNTQINGFVTNGIRLELDNLNLVVNNVSISNGTGYPVQSRGNLIGKFSNLTVGTNTNNYIAIYAGNQYQNATWTNFGIPYLFLGTYTINSGANLVLNPGINVIFSNNSALYVNGLFSTLGTVSEPISIKGTTTGTGSTWYGIRYQNTSAICSLNYTNISNAGKDENYSFPDEMTMLYASNADLNITGCNFTYSDYNLIKLEGGSIVNFTDCVLQNAGQTGIIINNSLITLIRSSINNCISRGIYFNTGTLNFGSTQTEWNKIFANGINLYNNTQTTLNAPYVYWGSLDSGIIDSKLYDNEEGKGLINFEPWYNETTTQLYYYQLDTPANVQIILISENVLQLSWNPVTGASSYRIIYANTPDSQSWNELVNMITTTTYNINTPQAIQKRFYRIIAVP